MKSTAAKVLLVDDTKAHRKLIRRALKRAEVNIALIEAESLSTARTLLATPAQQSTENTFDLAIIDLNLTDGFGTELVTELRKKTEYRNLPIIILSTSTLESDIEAARREGASCYLTKSSDPERFQQQIINEVKRYLLPV